MRLPAACADVQVRIERVVRIGAISYLSVFFQAEDGIRDLTVTGVQTCALPIYGEDRGTGAAIGAAGGEPDGRCEIGRGSCRERVYISVVAVSLKKKKYVATESVSTLRSLCKTPCLGHVVIDAQRGEATTPLGAA